MGIEYCEVCDRQIDTDHEPDHGYEAECQLCDGTGEVDSGGFDPQGHGINISCQCQEDNPYASIRGI